MDIFVGVLPWGSGEKAFGFFKKGLFFGMGGFVADFGEFLEFLPLVTGQLCGDLDVDPDIQIPGVAAAQIGNAFAAKTENFSTGSTGRDLDDRFAIKRGHLNFAAETRFDEGDGNLAEKVGILADKKRVFLDMDHHIEIAGLAAAKAAFTLADRTEA